VNLDPDPWDRPSFDLNVKPEMAERKIRRKDLLIPKGQGKLRMFALTLVGGVSMALLYVWPPLMIVVLVSTVGIGAVWIWLTLAIAAGLCWLTLFTLALRESAADRRYAEQLRLPG
jgi:hypothetical protein